jgi:ABC-type nitrate/sulfonate/bicarbonate transport system substrate-binding protein
MVMKKAVLALVVILSLGPICDGYSQEQIRVGYGAVSIQSGLVWIAKLKGLFAKYGLSPEIVYIPGGSTNIQALISGNLEVTQLTGAPGVAANLEGADIVYIALNLDKLNYQPTRPRSSARSSSKEPN